jgi:hypothetical protein
MEVNLYSPVNADFVDLCGVITNVLDMTEYMATAVLANEITNISS